LASRHSIQVIIKKLEENGVEFIHLTNLLTDHDLYKGLFKLNSLPGSLFRRIDILIVPFDELGSALIQWTGNDLFNRRLRTLAKSKSMKLTQHGLFSVEPDGSSTKIASKTEMDVFNALGR
jgi:DNA polymerase/3'-5' exonuclease PolX